VCVCVCVCVWCVCVCVCGVCVFMCVEPHGSAERSLNSAVGTETRRH